MNLSYLRTGRQCILALAATAALAVPALAQPQGNIRSITHIRLKPDRAGDWQAAIKDFNAQFKAAGWDKPRFVFQSLSGPAEFVLVTYHEKWAELDSPLRLSPKLKDQAGALSALNSRMMQCSESSARILDEVQVDLSLPRAAEPAAIFRVTRSRVRPEKVNDYVAMVKSDVLPAMKKAGVKSFTVAQVRYGAPNTEFMSSMGFAKWADLDGPPPIRQAMGEQGFAQYLAKARSLVLSSEINIYGFRRDLSYVPGAGATGGN